MPIRPIINWRNAPAYELAKRLTKTLHNHLHLPYTYNIQNTTQLITELKTIQFSKYTRICSFDIENIYTNIPRTEATNIIATILKTNSSINNNNNSLKEIIHIMEQNYFQFEQKFYKQTDGLAMGAPTSAIISKAYIQNMEHKQIYPILVKRQITRSFRYVDDILVICDQTKTNMTKNTGRIQQTTAIHKIYHRKRVAHLHQLSRPVSALR
jgi:hypothetical protein